MLILSKLYGEILMRRGTQSKFIKQLALYVTDLALKEQSF